MWVWMTVALAATPADLPEVPSDLFRPAIDGGPFLGVEVGTRADGPTAGLYGSWVRAPVRFDDGGGELVNVIDDALASHVGARLSLGPVQVGGSAPLYLVVRGLANPESRAVLGDPSLDVKATWRVKAWHFGALGRLGVPLGAASRQLGYPGPFVDVGGLAQLTAGSFQWVANLGVRITPTLQLGPLEVDDLLWGRLGGAFVRGPWAVSAEVHGGIPLRGLDVTAAPVEGLLGGERRFGALGAERWGGARAIPCGGRAGMAVDRGRHLAGPINLAPHAPCERACSHAVSRRTMGRGPPRGSRLAPGAPASSSGLAPR